MRNPRKKRNRKELQQAGIPANRHTPPKAKPVYVYINNLPKYFAHVWFTCTALLFAFSLLVIYREHTLHRYTDIYKKAHDFPRYPTVNGYTFLAISIIFFIAGKILPRWIRTLKRV